MVAIRYLLNNVGPPNDEKLVVIIGLKKIRKNHIQIYLKGDI